MRSPPKPHMIGFVTALSRRWYLRGGIFLVAFASLLALLVLDGAPATIAGLGCALAILFSVRLDHTKTGATWYLLAGGAALLGLTAVLGAGPERFGARDAFLTAGLLTIATGVGLLLAATFSDRDWGSVIDTAAITIAAALVVWVTLLASDLNKASIAGGIKLAALLYCLATLMLFALSVRLVLGLRVWTHATVLLCLAVGFLIAFAITSAAVRLHELTGVAWVTRSALIVAFALLTASALDPSMRKLGSAASKRRQELTPRRLVLLAAAALTAPWLLSVQAARGAQQLDIAATVVCSTTVVGLVIVRLAGLVLRQQRATNRELVLRRAVRGLASAEDHDRVCKATVEAAVALAGEQERVRASLILGSGRSAVEFATSGEAIAGRKHEESVKLTLQKDRIGELVLESERPLGDEIVSALKSLASQAVLALESLQRTKDLLEERRELESELLRRSHLDTLTALPNRSHFLERADAALTRIQRTREPVSVMIVNLDDFKTVNDTLGHVAGDELLRAVSDRLIASVRTDDTCARLGSDEWAVLIEESPPESPKVVADRIMTSLERPFVLLGQHEVLAHASIGSATVSPATEDEAEDAAELLRNAEVAMFHAKRHGRAGFEVFEPAMRAAVAERLALKAELERAVVASEFVIHYQPIVMLESGDICGVEALVRWKHPERGLIPPFHFIPLAEETGLIVPLGRFVLHEALRQGRAWQKLIGQPDFVMSINLSGRQLDHGTLVNDVGQAIERTGIDPQTVILEITETALMEDVEAAIEHLNELKTLGIQVAIDDFGTGYSSLQYLRQFPADIIKVAKPFVDGVVERGSDEYRIADAIVRLGETFGLRALAEGIELPEQREMLRDLRCELGQGFLFSRPLEPEAIEALLKTPDPQAFASLP
jgi:diguanylate cyclase (GGDEF)-like protein